MAASSKFKQLLFKLKLPEMRIAWLLWGIFSIILFISFLKLDILWASAIAILIIPFGTFFLYKEFKVAVANLETRISSGRLESIITNLEDAVIAYNNDFKILIFNSAAERVFNLNKTQVIGQTIGPEKASESRLQLLVQTLFPSLAPSVVGRSEPNKFPQVVDISFNNPPREFRVSTDRIIDKNNRPLGFVKVIRDRTRETQLIKSKSEFVSVAAHQLRTPLTAINWTLEGVAKNPDLNDQDKALVQNGLKATTNLLKTVNDLLDTAEIEEGRFGYKLEHVDLIKFIEGILANAQVLAKKYGLNLYFDKGNITELKLQIDPTKLGLALSNLVDNAMKYNSKEGSVTVRVKQLPDKPYVQIAVQDTGVGIPPTDIKKLFDKFFRAQNARKVKADGSGLGLYITKNIITSHGGTIWVESTLGRGTTFYFTLPTDPDLIPKGEIPTL